MRILMLAQFYPPIIGGEERHVHDLSTELVKRGHEVAVATLWHPGQESFEVDQGVRVHRIHSSTQRAGWLFREPVRRHAPPFPDPEAVWGLRRVIRLEKPEIVHSHNWLLYSFLPLKRWSQARLVVTLHDYSLVCSKKRFMYRDAVCSGPGIAKCLNCSSQYYGIPIGVPTVLSNWVMGLAGQKTIDKFLAVSQATAAGNGLAGSGISYQVIPNFVPDKVGVERDATDPRLAQLPRGDFLLFVGDVSRDKGIHILLRAYEGLKNPPPLVLIGRRCPDTPSEFPPGVLFMESWPHHSVMEAWRRCSIALAPSVWPEPFGIVVIEAMSVGRPVIASRIGGLTDIVMDGETGLLVPPGDIDRLREAIARLTADRGLQQRMGEAGLRRVALFRSSNVVPRIEGVYRTVLEAAQSAKNNLELGNEKQKLS